MDENRLEGSARNLGGRIQEGVGQATGEGSSRTTTSIIAARLLVHGCFQFPQKTL